MDAERKARGGAVRLLTKDDFAKKDSKGASLVGWQPTCLGEGGLVNLRGYALLRVVVQKMVEPIPTPMDLYDQPMLVENVGSIVVPLLPDGRVGLIESYRMVGERLLAADPNYVARLDAEGKWAELLRTLGAWKWEVPRGIPPVKVPGTFAIEADLARAAAKLEALEEAGWTLGDLEVVGRVNTNPTFFTHAQYVVRGTVVGQGEQQPEKLEMIGRVRFFSPERIRTMVQSGGLDDGMTKAALADAGFRY